ncbi:hypothetical protein BTN49_0907 [Candidatus Enterovibrio escicola]|uniref:Uncharacterized protein n=1 Tax=Candidatus Enterovibrio escicola TaxID=1927127 RepID=A0A2A5T708_9GAMM|nr:hypothetical protein BTN49_0907 [Candidatus Enterovibrio escacola]
MSSQALRIYGSAVFHQFKDYELSEKLQLENGGVNSHFSITEDFVFIEYLSDFTYHHIFQIEEYVK